jgi:hypothetical protein
MTGAYTLALLALFLLGATVGCIAIVSLAIHRDKDITTGTSDLIARGARITNGVHARRPGVLHEQVAHRHDLPSHSDWEW